MTVASGGAKVGKGAQEFILQIVLLDAYLGTPEKTNRELARLQPRTAAKAAPKHGYRVTSIRLTRVGKCS